MPMETYTTRVKIPSHETFAGRFPQFGTRVQQGDGARLWDFVMRPETFLYARLVTEELELPAVAGIANACRAMMGGRLEDADKQLVGGLVCCLMEENGYAKDNRKRAIPQDGWTKGEVYRRR